MSHPLTSDKDRHDGIECGPTKFKRGVVLMVIEVLDQPLILLLGLVSIGIAETSPRNPRRLEIVAPVGFEGEDAVVEDFDFGDGDQSMYPLKTWTT